MLKRMFTAKVEKPKTVPKTIRMPEILLKILEAHAPQVGEENVNSLVNLILDQYVQVQMEAGTITQKMVDRLTQKEEKTA